MRVLFSIHPATSHLHAAVPLARALLARGHEVLVATGADRCADLVGWGLPAAPTLPAGAMTALVPGLLRSHRGAQVRLLAGLAEQSREPLLALAPTPRPDVVVRDSYELSGLVVAEQQQVPQVVLGIGLRPELPWLQAVLAGTRA